MYCVFHHISGHLPRQIWFWKFSTKTWASVRPPPLLGQMPNFFRKMILMAPLKGSIKNCHINHALHLTLILEEKIVLSKRASSLRYVSIVDQLIRWLWHDCALGHKSRKDGLQITKKKLKRSLNRSVLYFRDSSSFRSQCLHICYLDHTHGKNHIDIVVNLVEEHSQGNIFMRNPLRATNWIGTIWGQQLDEG